MHTAIKRTLFFLGMLTAILGVIWMSLPHEAHDAIKYFFLGGIQDNTPESSHFLDILQGLTAVVIGTVLVMTNRNTKKKETKFPMSV